MVFPRNEVGHLKQLAGVGLRTFRGPDAGPATAIRRVSEPLGQAANLAGKALPLPPPVVAAKRSGGMIDVPGSMLLMARNGVRRFVLPSVTRAKLKSGLERARRSGGIFHLWLHPSNFYHRWGLTPIARRPIRVWTRSPSVARAYHLPVFGIEAQGSCFGLGAPFCKNSIEILSGERMKAM